MRFNKVGQLCTILSFASWVEQGYGSRIYPRSDIISSSSSISSPSSSKSSTSSASGSSSTSSTSTLSSSSSSSSSTSIQIITESVIPIKLSTTSPSSSASPTSTEVKSPSSSITKSTIISADSSAGSSTASLTPVVSSSASQVAEKPKTAEIVSSGNQASISTSVLKSSAASTAKPTGVSTSVTKDSTAGEESTGNPTNTASVKPIPNNSSPSSTSKGASTKVSYSPGSTITTGPKYDSHAKWGVFPWGNHPAWGGYPWGNSTIPSNTCWHEDSQDNPWWPGCTISAWQVRLSYFPKPSGTLRYPTTYYEPKLKITMTSPSIYMVLETVAASNKCGQLGPQFTNYPLALNPSDVSTLQLFHDAAAHSMIGAPQILDLDDIATDCEDAAFEGRTLTAGPHWTTHPYAGDDFNRCSPRIAWPPQLKSLGYKYWEHCTKLNEDYGLFDPPGAVPPLSSGAGLLPSPSPTPAVKVVPTPTPAAPVQNPAPVQPSNTSPPQPAAPTPVINNPVQQSSPVAPPNQPSSPVEPVVQPSNVANPPANQPPPVVQPSNPVGQPSNPVAQPINPGNNNQNGPGPTPAPPTPSNAPQTPSPSVVAVVGGQTISAQADSPNIILPNGSTANVGTVATITNPDNNKPPVVVSVAPSGVYIVSGGDGSTPNNFYPNPVVVNPGAPTPLANSGGVVDQTPKPIATIGGEVVNAIPGASTVVIKGQTLTSGGAPVTIAGTDIVATLGNQGLTVQSAGGAVSSYALPTPASPASPGITAPAIIGTINGNVITAAPGASSVVVGSETLKLGGPPITLSNNEVISLGSGGIVVQVPGGAVKTLPLSMVSGYKSALGTADLIASIIGVTKAGGENPPSATSILVSQPPNISKTSSLSIVASASLSSLVTSSITSQASSSSQLNGTTSFGSNSSSRSLAISIVTDSGSPSKVSPAVATVIKNPTAASTSAKSSGSSHLCSSGLMVIMSAVLGAAVVLM